MAMISCLQPVLIELGNTSNPEADYCRVYNYYASVGSPASCATPAQGTGNNGAVIGIFDQDNVNSSLTHTESYTDDSLNRLTTAAATGSSTYNLTFAYDRYGNMTCQTNGNTSGYCDNLSFNGNNQITTPGFSYDAAGNMTAGNLPGAYTFDDQGHVTNESGSAITRNAYGWDVEEKGTGYQEEQVYDPQGNELGTWGVTRNNWDYVFIPLGARILAVTSSSGCCGSTGTTFLHANHLDSTTMTTDYAGDVAEDLLLYPWGSRWTYAGQLNDEHFAGLHNGDDLKESPARTYVSPIGRWLTPDPENAGADPPNPQSWNAYAYALNNPTTRIDPSGLYVCSGSKEERQTIHDALHTVQQAESKLKAGSQEQQKLESVLNFYGKEGVKNGVTVKFANLQGKEEANTSTFSLLGHFKHTTITFDLSKMRSSFGNRAGVSEGVEFGAIAAHEGQHGVDQWANGMPRTFNQYVQTETNAFTTQSYVNRALGTRSAYGIWDPTWNPALAEPLSKAAIASNAQQAAGCDVTGRCP